MKDLLIMFGKVALAVIIVGGIILGTMQTKAKDVETKFSTEIDTIIKK